jgi:hypothetical protein
VYLLYRICIHRRPKVWASDRVPLVCTPPPPTSLYLCPVSDHLFYERKGVSGAAKRTRQWAGTLVKLGECELCPIFALYCDICHKNEEKSWTHLSQGSRKVPSEMVLGAIRLVDLAAILWATSTGLLTFITLSLWFRWLGSTLSETNFCQVAKLRGSPYQLTLSWNSRLGLWCGWQRTELPDPP